MLKIVYGKQIEELTPRDFGFRQRYFYIWRESFSMEVSDKTEHEIVFGLNEKGEDEIGKVLEIWNGNKKVFDHTNFDFARLLHGLESLDDESWYKDLI